MVAGIKAMACERPEQRQVPLSGWRSTDLAVQAMSEGLVESISSSTVRRWLHGAAIKPWQFRWWIFLVATHPFPNGNGRFGRAAADYLVNALGATSFTWGAGLNLGTDDLRSKYLDALQRADRGDISGLMAFART